MRSATTSSSSAPAPAAGRWRTRWPTTGARILVLERGDFVPQEEENWNPEAVWKHLRYRVPRAMDRPQRPRVPAVHALLRRRQHEVLGQRALSACAARTSRRSSMSTASRPAWPIDYDTLEPYYDRAERLYHVRGQHGVDPDRASAASVPVRRRPARARHGGRSSSSFAAQGLHPSPLPLGLLRLGRAEAACCAARATRSRARSREERRGSLLHPRRRCGDRRSRSGPTRSPGGC